MCVLSRFRSQAVSESIYEDEEIKEKAKIEQAEPVWEFREEYLANIQRAEQQERRDLDMKREEEAEGEVKWWL